MTSRCVAAPHQYRGARREGGVGERLGQEELFTTAGIKFLFCCCELSVGTSKAKPKAHPQGS